MRIRVVLVWLALSAGVTQVRADDAPPPIDVAIAKATAAHKPLLIEFTATWCKPCRVFAQKVLPDDRVKAAISDFVFVQYDADEASGEAAVDRFAIKSYPTFLVIDSRGTERVRHSGMLDAEEFVMLLDEAKPLVAFEQEIIAALKAKPRDPQIRAKAARWFAAHDREQDALVLYEALAKDKTAPLEIRNEADAISARMQRLALWKRHLLVDTLVKITKDLARATPEDLAIATIDSGMSFGEARTVVKKVLDAQTDLGRLNALIYVALAVGAYDEALEAGKRLAVNRDNAQYLDTLAECFHVTGNRELAVEASDASVNLAIGTELEPVVQRNRERFKRTSKPSDEVVEWQAKGKDVWQRLSNVDRLAKHTPPDPVATKKQRDASMNTFMTRQGVAFDIAKACRRESEGAEQAYIRVVVDDAGHVISSVLLLEPGASDALRTCLTTKINAAMLPPTDSKSTRFALPISFRSR